MAFKACAAALCSLINVLIKLLPDTIALALARLSRPSFSFAGKGLWDFPSPVGLLWGGCSRDVLSLEQRGCLEG